MKKDNAMSCNFVCFTYLAYEFELADRKQIENKIKSQLNYYKLGKYSQETVDYIRSMKDDLYNELSKDKKYWRSNTSGYAEIDDFDIEKIISDYSVKYCQIERGDMWRIINFAIYLYYLK